MGPEAKPRSLDEEYVSKQTGELSILRVVLVLAARQKSPPEPAGSYWLQPGALRWWGWEAAVPPLCTLPRPDPPALRRVVGFVFH